jgi:OOP family OmpA-OmpF porin
MSAVDATAAELIYKKEPVLIRDTMVEVVRTTDNFIILYDSSSSMAGPYKGTGMTKIEALNKILKDKVEKMPELSWMAGLYSFKVTAGRLESSIHPYYDMKRYDKEDFAAAIDQLPTKAVGPPLLQRALEELGDILEGLSGRTVVFLFTDGTYTSTGELRTPAQMARDLAAKHDVCFYVVSHAEGAAQEQLLESVAAINECSRVVPFDFVMERPEYFTGALFVIEKKVIERLERTDKLVGVKIDNILFDFNSADIRSEFNGELDELGGFLQSNPDAYVIVDGFTDGTGPSEYNLGLSRRRAESVGKYLMDNFNIDEARIITQWYGVRYPIASNATPQGRALNRRVVCIIAGLD